jgi:hypothetical protein
MLRPKRASSSVPMRSDSSSKRQTPCFSLFCSSFHVLIAHRLVLLAFAFSLLPSMATRPSSAPQLQHHP